MDGSAEPFVFLIECAGVVEQDAPRPRDQGAEAGERAADGTVRRCSRPRDGFAGRLRDRVRSSADRQPGHARATSAATTSRPRSPGPAPSACERGRALRAPAWRSAARSTTPSWSARDRVLNEERPALSTTSSCATRSWTASATSISRAADHRPVHRPLLRPRAATTGCCGRCSPTRPPGGRSTPSGRSSSTRRSGGRRAPERGGAGASAALRPAAQPSRSTIVFTRPAIAARTSGSRICANLRTSSIAARWRPPCSSGVVVGSGSPSRPSKK